jgi:hypothetical protein
MLKEYMTGLEFCHPEEALAAEKTGPCTMADFIPDDQGHILGCPRGLSPAMFMADAKNDGVAAIFGRSTCRTCHGCDDRPAKVKSGLARLTRHHSQARIAKRRACHGARLVQGKIMEEPQYSVVQVAKIR